MANSEWKCLQPEKLAIDPNAVSAEDDWKFWYKTFTNFATGDAKRCHRETML